MNERELIDAAIAAWNDGGPEAFLEYLAPDVEWHAPPEFPDGAVWHDRDSLAPEMREQFGTGGVFTGSTMELVEAIPAPHGWLVEGRQRGEHASGMEVGWRVWFVAQLEDGLLKRMWVFMDREPALRKAGL
jgi:hypothetical protein